jgi:ABC-type transport system involved in multi-copper enzyme maturation permease subunit
MYALMDEETVELMKAAGMGMTAQGQFFDAFSVGNNLGLIAPVLLAIILCKDFSFGTVRNKIIGGYSRKQIVLSMYLVCLTVLFGIMFLHALLSLAVSLIFFPFRDAGQTFGYFIGSLGLEVLVYLLVAALVCWLCALRKNVGLVIVVYVAVVLGLSLVAGILSGVELVMTEFGGNETALKIIRFFQNINVYNFALVIGKGTGYEAKELLSYILTPLAGTGLILGWSVLRFKKRDLK